jgi:type III pantothenate kinase
VSVLLVDIGNSRIKWAVLRGGGVPGRQRAAVHAGWTAAQFRHALFAGVRGRATGITRVLAVSVAAAQVERAFAAAVRAATGHAPQFVRTTRRAAGVTNGYRAAWRLGADRWMASLGAYALQRPARAVCIVDVGTALTIDLLDARGLHRGGAIVPGPQLMVASLLAGTSGIGRRAAGRDAAAQGGRAGPARALFARATRAGLDAGARHAAAALIDRAIAEAQRLLGPRARVELLLTGGGAAAVRTLVRAPHRVVPDLVLRGLAVLCTLDARS